MRKRTPKAEPNRSAVGATSRCRIHMSSFVFLGPTGLYGNASVIASHFTALVAQLEVKPLTLHGLRHTHATLLLSVGRNPLEVSERLGHNSVAFTLNRYGHVIPSDAAAVDAAGEASVSAANRWSGI